MNNIAEVYGIMFEAGFHIGEYEIIDKVRTGPLSNFFRAKHQVMNREVFIEIPRENFFDQPEMLDRIRNAARMSGRLEHAHILPIYDYREFEATPYLVMRYVKSGTLQEHLQANPQMPLGKISVIFRQAAEALDHIHANGIIHRDVMTHHIFLESETKAYLSGFYLAFDPSEESIEAGRSQPALGRYMSPEILMGAPIGPPSDQYRLGVVLYEAIAGAAPFDTSVPLSSFAQMNAEPLSPRQFRPDLPIAVERVMLQSLEKDPEDRFSSCVAFADAFDSALAGSRRSVFISYRRADSAMAAGRIFDRLGPQYGADTVFIDIDAIRPGEDFAKVIDETLRSCAVVLVVIGSQWLTLTDAVGRRRLDDPNDFVRLEVKTALDQGMRVIPVLVEGASFPPSAALPEDLRGITRLNAVTIDTANFHRDLNRIINELDDLLPTSQ